MKFPIFFLITFLSVLTAAEERKWSNVEGTKYFHAEFIKRTNNQVTLLRSDGKETTFEISKLHKDDRAWLDVNHPLKTSVSLTVPDKEFVFDTLKFGDTRDEVSKKLAASRMVETSVDGIFQGRTGLNGIYRTRSKIGGMFCYLSFDWENSGTLKEITLQTESKAESQYQTELAACWAELIEVIGPIHGKPVMTGNMPNPKDLSDGQILGSHLWKIEGGGSVLLGTSKDSDGYQVIVRFTTEKLTDG